MTTKFSKVVTYLEELPHIKLLDPTFMWFCVVTLCIKYFISQLSLDQWLLAR